MLHIQYAVLSTAAIFNNRNFSYFDSHRYTRDRHKKENGLFNKLNKEITMLKTLYCNEYTIYNTLRL